MINHYTLFHEPGHACLTFVRITDMADIRDLFESLFDDPRYARAPLPILVDLSLVTELPFGIAHIEQLVALFNKWHTRHGLPRVAILATQEYVFGLSRMWELLKDTVMNLTSGVFRDRNQALAWLLEPVRDSA